MSGYRPWQIAATTGIATVVVATAADVNDEELFAVLLLHVAAVLGVPSLSIRVFVLLLLLLLLLLPLLFAKLSFNELFDERLLKSKLVVLCKKLKPPSSKLV